jgi:hypothetical protein
MLNAAISLLVRVLHADTQSRIDDGNIYIERINDNGLGMHYC